MRYKFRVWSNKNNEMYYVIPEADLQLNFGINDGWALWEPYGELCTNENAELMQWTGMFDQHGKSIYEGDIIDFSIFDYNGSDTQYRGVVKFSSGKWEIWNSVDSEFYGSDGGFMLYWVHQQDDSIEVVGNIYESGGLSGS